MKKEIWGFNVIGPQGLDAHNDFAVGPNDEGDDVVLRVNQAELTGKEFATLKEIAEGGPTPGGGGFPEQDLDDPTFVPEANHYYKQKAGEKPEPTLQPFKVGDVLKVGDKIHFDITKEAELLAWMKTLEYERDSGTSHEMVYTYIEQSGSSYNIDTLVASRLPGAHFGIENDVYVLSSHIIDAQDTDGAVYISEDLSSLSPALTKGFHTDANGDVTVIAGDDGITEYPATEVIDTNPPAWNGIFAGILEEAPASQFIDGVLYFYDGEEYHAITGEGGEGTLDYNKLENVPIINLTENKTTVLSAFAIGDEIKPGDKIHFDTTKKDEFAAYLAGLTYGDAPTSLFAGDLEHGSLVLMAMSLNDITSGMKSGYILTFGESQDAIVFSTVTDSFEGIVLTEGFMNLDEDGNFTLNTIATAETIQSLIDSADAWNGAIISKADVTVSYDPQPEDGKFYLNKTDGQIYKYTAAKPAELEAFKVGQTLSQGDKIHFDITKGDELAEYLRGLEYDSSHNGPVFMEAGSNFKLNAVNMADNVYVLVLTDTGGSPQNIAAVYATDVVEGIITTPGFQYGEHRLDNNGDYTLLGGYTIATINDTTPPTWNGVICGVIGESQPELFDKVVLESEINGATIVDLGSIEMDSGNNSKEWHITKAQYDQAFGDNVIVKVTVSGSSSDYFTLYAPKNSQYADSNQSRLSFSGMVDVQQFYIEIGSDSPGEYMAYLELIEPDHLYRHNILFASNDNNNLNCSISLITARSSAYDQYNPSDLVNDANCGPTGRIAASGSMKYINSLAIITQLNLQYNENDNNLAPSNLYGVAWDPSDLSNASALNTLAGSMYIVEDFVQEL